MGQKRRKFSPGEKLAILRQQVMGKMPVSDVCDEHGISPTMFYRWQKELFEGGAAAFERRRNGPSKKVERENERLKSKLAQRDEVIAELLEDHVRLKKKVGAD